MRRGAGTQQAHSGNHQGLVWLASGRVQGAMRAVAGEGAGHGLQTPAPELAPETMGGGIRVWEQWCDLVRADVDLAAIWKLECLPWESTGWG